MPNMDIDEVRKIQGNYPQKEGVNFDVEGIGRIEGKFWILAKEKMAKLKILVNVHCGIRENCTHKRTESLIKTFFNKCHKICAYMLILHNFTNRRPYIMTTIDFITWPAP